MKTLYIDCSNGISGDMLRRALAELAGMEEAPEGSPRHGGQDHEHGGDSHENHGQGHEGHNHKNHGQDHEDHSHFHRSYEDVQKIIEESDKSRDAKDAALSIYEVIAKAEAKVHGETLETIHFHEVGRDQAIANALSIGSALEKLGLNRNEILAGRARIVVSPICDGNGFVDCAHGRIPVPVPAVRAMMEKCGWRTDGCGQPEGCSGQYPAYEFKTLEEVETEMVTPSGLAALIGIGAVPAGGAVGMTGTGCSGGAVGGSGIRGAGGSGGMMFMEGQITESVEVTGTRNTGRGGLRAYLIEK